MKYVAMLSALLMLVNPASAQDVKKAVYKSDMEEVTVRALDLRQFEGKKAPGVISVGLSDKVLVHIYDAKTDTWKFVGTKLTTDK
jgi:hypothetical protein